MRKREEKEEIRKKEEEEREREKLREKLGHCADGSWINIGYYKTLTSMGFTEVVTLSFILHCDLLDTESSSHSPETG